MQSNRRLLKQWIQAGRCFDSARVQWTVFVLLGVVLSIASVLVARQGVADRQALQTASAHWQVLQSAATKAPDTLPPPAPPQPDFTAQLPAAASLPDVMNTLQSASTRASVRLQNVQAKERAPSPESLGRAELVVVLRGAYAGIRQVVADLLSAQRHVTVQALRFQRTEASPDLEASLTLSVWSRPAAPRSTGQP